jgi:dCMP deaminase
MLKSLSTTLAELSNRFVERTRRPKWDELHMLAAILAATRSSCLVRAVGAAAVLNNRVIASGYNGAPPGITSCLQTGECFYKRVAHTEWQRNGGDLEVLNESFKYQCIAVHAEANVVAQCLQMGISTVGATLYVTNMPCPKCARDVVISGRFKEVVVWKGYLSNPLLTTDEERETRRLLAEAGIQIRYTKLSKARIFLMSFLMMNVGDRTSYRFAP